MKCLILAPFDEEFLRRLGEKLSVIKEDWLETGRLYSPEELHGRIEKEGINILVVEADFVFDEVIEASPLKLIGTVRGEPYNVDVERATERGIPVIYTPGRNAIAVAELTIAFMLSLSRRLFEADSFVRERWEDPVGGYRAFRGREIWGSTVGIIGFGRVGREVARRVRALGANVLVYDPYREEEIRKEGFTPSGLEFLLRSSDFITLHCSLTPETEGMIGREEIGKMKRSSFLINTARAEIVDEDALAEALKEGLLGGAAFDVFPSHPVNPKSPLLSSPNTILTPHIGGATLETVRRQSEMITRDIELFLSGRRPINLLNPEVWDTSR